MATRFSQTTEALLRLAQDPVLQATILAPLLQDAASIFDNPLETAVDKDACESQAAELDALLFSATTNLLAYLDRQDRIGSVPGWRASQTGLVQDLANRLAEQIAMQRLAGTLRPDAGMRLDVAARQCLPRPERDWLKFIRAVGVTIAPSRWTGGLLAVYPGPAERFGPGSERPIDLTLVDTLSEAIRAGLEKAPLAEYLIGCSDDEMARAGIRVTPAGDGGIGIDFCIFGDTRTIDSPAIIGAVAGDVRARIALQRRTSGHAVPDAPAVATESMDPAG